MIITECKQFFQRHGIVNSGIYRDRDLAFLKSYQSGLLTGKYNVLLKGDYPGEATFAKLLTSLTFKINPEDTAFEQQAGLVEKSTDAKAIARDSSDNGIFEIDGSISGTSGISQDNIIGSGQQQSLSSSNFTTAVLPHQLSNIVNNNNVDGVDTAGTPVTANGVTITPLTVALTSPTGRRRKNFKIAAAVEDSIAIDNSTGALKLVNDEAIVTEGIYRSTGSNKGWKTFGAVPVTDTVSFNGTNTITLTIEYGVITGITIA